MMLSEQRKYSTNVSQEKLKVELYSIGVRATNLQALCRVHASNWVHSLQ
jgi:hypothetical protein